MERKNSFIIYLDYQEQFELLSNEQLGELLRALMQYEKTGIVPELDGMVKMAFAFMKAQLDRDREKYNDTCEKNKQNGKLGGRPKKEKANAINEKEIKTERFFRKPNNSQKTR